MLLFHRANGEFQGPLICGYSICNFCSNNKNQSPMTDNLRMNDHAWSYMNHEVKSYHHRSPA